MKRTHLKRDYLAKRAWAAPRYFSSCPKMSDHRLKLPRSQGGAPTGKQGLRYRSAAGGWRRGRTRCSASAQRGPGSLAPEGKNPLLVVVHLGPGLLSVLTSREEPGTQVFTQCVSIFNFGNYFRFFQEPFHRPNILCPRASGSLGLLVLDVTGDISRLQQR